MHSFSPLVEQILRERMASGKYATENDLLLEAFQSLDAEDQDMQAIQEGIDSVDRGEEGASLQDAFRQLRAEHQVRESA